MAKQRPDKPAPKAKGQTARPVAGDRGWPLWARLTVSVWVAWHLFAVFISPFNAFSAPRASELVASIATSPYLRWYSDPVYINGGYQFFSPDPPVVSMLVRYRVTDEQGGVIAQGEFPNRANDSYAKQWPRLWYHRHMMLADQAGDLFPDLAPEDNQRLTLRAYGRHLLRRHGGSDVQLDFVQHYALLAADAWPPRREAGDRGPAEVERLRSEEPYSPTDERLYQIVFSVTESADRLDEPLLPAASPRPAEPLPPGGAP